MQQPGGQSYSYEPSAGYAPSSLPAGPSAGYAQSELGQPQYTVQGILLYSLPLWLDGMSYQKTV